jgi:PAS domain-containing protein
MRHLATGVTKIIGVGNRRLPILRKDGLLSTMTLSVTKVTVGNDFMFVGLVKQAKDGLIGTDHEGKILYSSDTINFLFGWEESDLKSKNISAFVTGPHVPRKVNPTFK